MQTTKHKGLTWIDVENPKSKDILFIKENFQLDSIVLEEFTSPSQRPRAEEFNNCLYVVIHVPLFNRKTRVTTPGELDIVITRSHLITSHIGENIPLKAILKEFNGNETTKEQAMSGTTGFLLYFILEKLLSSCFPKIDHINEQVNVIEKEIFADNHKAMVRETSIIKRDILAFRRTLKPQRSILESLAQKRYQLLEQELDKYFQDLIGTNIRVWNALENTKEVIEALEETNNSMVSHRLNRTMRFLAAVSLITFTLSVTAGIFSMIPFAHQPAAKRPETFWIVLLFMTLIALSLLLFFRKRRWF